MLLELGRAAAAPREVPAGAAGAARTSSRRWSTRARGRSSRRAERSGDEEAREEDIGAGGGASGVADERRPARSGAGRARPARSAVPAAPGPRRRVASQTDRHGGAGHPVRARRGRQDPVRRRAAAPWLALCEPARWFSCLCAGPAGRAAERPVPMCHPKGGTVKALVFHKPSDVRVEDVPDPRIEEPTDVIVRASPRPRSAARICTSTTASSPGEAHGARP